VQDYTHVLRWADAIAQRPAVQRGRMVNRTWGAPESQLHERHDASDFDRPRNKTSWPAGDRRMITLYDCATAPSPRRARILLAEKGIAHETCRSTCAAASSWARPTAPSTRSARCRRCAPTTACC
jgi:hypothetical protein